LKSINFNGCNFAETDFSGCDLKEARFDNAVNIWRVNGISHADTSRILDGGGVTMPTELFNIWLTHRMRPTDPEEIARWRLEGFGVDRITGEPIFRDGSIPKSEEPKYEVPD
jgi:Pentapeptide repeats (8 copies)